MAGSVRDLGPRIVYKDKSIVFAGDGRIEQGNIVEVFDDFTGDTIDANAWSSVADAGGTAAAINVQANGAIRLTTSATDDHRTDFAGEVVWLPSKGLVFEARIKVDDITPTAICLGLSDAKSEATTLLAASLSVATFTTTASNGVYWLYDTDATTDTWRGIGVKADTDATAVNSSIAPVAATYQRFRIEVDTSGNAIVKILDDAQPTVSLYSAFIANACTAATLLTPYIGVQNRMAEARNLDVDFVYVAQLAR